MGWPSRSGPAGRPISAPLRSQAAPRPGGTCPRPTARLHLPPGATARVATSLIKPVPAAPGGTCPPARCPPPPATGRYGPRGDFTHQAGARITRGNVFPRLAARCYPPPSTTARVASSLFKPVPASPGGTSPPGSRPASTRYRALRLAWRLHSSSRACRRPPTAARARTALSVVVARRSRLTASRDYFSGAAGLARALVPAAMPPSRSNVIVTLRERGGGA